MSDKKISIVETGTVKVMPDAAYVSVKIEGKDMEYNKAITLAYENAANLIKHITACGIENKELKTSGLNVVPRYEYVNNKSEFAGYAYSQEVQFEIPLASDKMKKFTESLADFNVMCNLSYKLMNEKDAKNAALRNAINNAKEKAELIATAAGVELGEITKIEYGDIQPDIHPRAFAATCNADRLGAISNITPSEITVSEKVVIEWKVK